MDEFDVDLTIFGGSDMSVPIAAVRGRITRSATPPPVVHLLDHFTDTDDVFLTAHTMDVGGGWRPGIAGTLTGKIAGNRAVAGQPGNFGDVADALVADGKLTTTITWNSSDVLVGVFVRWSDPANWIAVRFDGSTAMLLQFVGSFATVLATSAFALANGQSYVIGVALAGQSISVSVDAAPVLIATGVAFNESATYVGVAWYHPTVAPLTSFDDFMFA